MRRSIHPCCARRSSWADANNYVKMVTSQLEHVASLRDGTVDLFCETYVNREAKRILAISEEAEAESEEEYNRVQIANDNGPFPCVGCRQRTNHPSM